MPLQIVLIKCIIIIMGHQGPPSISELTVIHINSLFSPIVVITNDAQNRNQLLHNFAKCVVEEGLDQPEMEWSPVIQHKYIMQPHLEAFLRIEVGDLHRFMHNHDNDLST